MELQENGTDTLNESMWLDQSPSPSYQQLSPPVQQGGRNVIATQQLSMDYQIPDGAILWTNEKHESPRNSPDTNNPLRSSSENRENSPNGVEASTSYHQYISNRKRRSNESNDGLDRKYIRRDGSLSSNVSSQGWSSKQVEELAEHLVADFDGSLSAIATNDLVNAVASYNMSEALLALPSLTVFKQEAPSPENQINNSNLNHVSQRSITGPYQNNGSIGLLVEPDSNNSNTTNNNAIGNNVSTTTVSNNADRDNQHNTTTGPCSRNVNNNSRGRITPYNFQQLLYANNNEEFSSPSSGNHVSSSQQDTEFNGDTRFQYVLGAATSMAIKLNEETLTYLNQGQPYELKLKKLGDLSAYRGRLLKSTIKICFHERRLQFTEREQMMAWERARPRERLLEVDVPLSYGMTEVNQKGLPKNIVEIIWDPTKEANVYIKINCISTEFTAKKHGGEKGVPFRVQVETKLDSVNGLRLHAASCQIKVFKLKGADRKHKQDQEKIRRKSIEKQELYQSSCECTVLTEVPLNLLKPSSPIRNSSDEGPFIANDMALVRNTRNAGSGGSPSDSGPEDVSDASPQMPRLPSPLPPDPATNVDVNIARSFELPENADAIQTRAWLRANGFQNLEATFRGYSANDFRFLTRGDLIEICGLVRGIQLYNRIKPRPFVQRTLYFALENNNETPLVWKVIYLYNLTSEALTNELLNKFNLPQDRLHSIWVQGPCSIRILICNEIVEHMKDEHLYTIEIIKDSPNDRLKLLLKRCPRP